MTAITPGKVAGAVLGGAVVYGLVALAQNTPMGDLMKCDACGRKHSGYGFVAFAQGTDPRICPNCGKPALRPASLLDMIAFWR